MAGLASYYRARPENRVRPVMSSYHQHKSYFSIAPTHARHQPAGLAPRGGQGRVIPNASPNCPKWIYDP